MHKLVEIFTSTSGRLSSKRVIGAVCIMYSMILGTTTFFASGMVDIPPNVNSTILQYLLIGGGMISVGTAEGLVNKNLHNTK